MHTDTGSTLKSRGFPFMLSLVGRDWTACDRNFWVQLPEAAPGCMYRGAI